MISCVILTKDEATTINGCIDSVKPWFDDIWVLDSGSSDATLSNAENAGAQTAVRIPPAPFRISDQRNWALDNLNLRNDWVLFLDADERATTDFVKDLFAELEHDNGGAHDSFYCCPKFMYHGTWLKRTKSFPTWEPRVLRRSSGVRYTGGVWETFTPNACAGYVREPYMHFPDAKGFGPWVEKHLRYAKWEAESAAGVRAVSPSARRINWRRVARAAGPLRPWLVVAGTCFLRGNILDGSAGRSYLRRILIYEIMIQEYLAEDKYLRGPEHTCNVIQRFPNAG